MPRILHIYKDYHPPVIGGIEKHLNLVCRGIADEFDVRVLVANTARGEARETLDGIDVVKASCWGRVASLPLCPSFPRLLKEWPADILHFHLPMPTGDLAWRWARPPGKIVVTYHSDIVRQRWALALYGPLLRGFLRRADAILPTSPNYVESSPYLRPLRDRCTVIPLGIPCENMVTDTSFASSQETAGESESAKLVSVTMFSPDSIRQRYAGPLIIFVGKLRYYKGLHLLIEAMKKIDATCLIIGDGPERDRLRRLIKENLVERKVQLLGELDDDAVDAHLRAADLFCLPSHLRSEAYGLCQLEAMTRGLPVVSARLDTGVPFVNRHGETGLLCEPASAPALAQALQRLLADDELRQRLGRQARQRAIAEFGAELMLDRIKQVYRAVLEGHPPPQFLAAP